MTTNPTIPTLLGVVLCGGRGSRMGGKDKGLVHFNGKPMAAYAIAALADCHHVVINANRNQDLYQSTFNLPVIADDNPHFDGPLAGMLAGLRYAKAHAKTHPINWIITAPCDAPYITTSYVQRLWQAKQNSQAKIFMADNGFRQPVFALLHTSLADQLAAFLTEDNKKLLRFYQDIGYERVIFPETTSLFSNINTDEQLI